MAGVTPESAMPFAVGERLAVPSADIAAEPRGVGAPLVGALAEGRHEACPYVVIELHKVGSYKRRDYSSNAARGPVTRR